MMEEKKYLKNQVINKTLLLQEKKNSTNCRLNIYLNSKKLLPCTK